MSDKNIMLFGPIHNLVRLWYVNGLLYNESGKESRHFATKKEALNAIIEKKVKAIARKHSYVSLKEYKLISRK